MPNEATWLIWSMYIRLLPEHVREKMRIYLSRSHHCSLERLEALTGIFKKYQHLLDKDWTYFIDLQTLNDYQPGLEPEAMKEKVNVWVNEIAEHSLPDFDFYEVYKYGVHSFFFDNYTAPSRVPITVRQFLSDPMYWATPGSSDGKRLVANDGIKARKTKWATAQAVSFEELWIAFHSPGYQINHATTKRELAKSRMIISGDLSNYLRMTYLAYWLEDVLRNHPHSTLFYNEKEMLTMWAQMVKNTVPLDSNINSTTFPSSKVNLTLDESKFDHMVNMKMNNIHWTEIGLFVAQMCSSIMKMN